LIITIKVKGRQSVDDSLMQVNLIKILQGSVATQSELGGLTIYPP